MENFSRAAYSVLLLLEARYCHYDPGHCFNGSISQLSRVRGSELFYSPSLSPPFGAPLIMYTCE